MHPNGPFCDALRHLARVPHLAGTRLVRLVGRAGANRYDARPLGPDASARPRPGAPARLTVINLAEPADEPGAVAGGTVAVAVCAHGLRLVFVRPARTPMFAARVVSSQGRGAYLVREQPERAPTALTRRPAATITACNLAELSLGPAAAVDTGQIVVVALLCCPGSPRALRYVFDHPLYAACLRWQGGPAPAVSRPAHGDGTRP